MSSAMNKVSKGSPESVCISAKFIAGQEDEEKLRQYLTFEVNEVAAAWVPRIVSWRSGAAEKEGSRSWI